MNAYLNYIIEANIGLILFLIAYVVVLKNETDFKSKRVFMLMGIVTSLTFPLLHIQFAGSSIPTVSQVMPSYILPKVSVSGEGQMHTMYSSVKFEDGWFYVQAIYLGGLSFFFIRFLFQIVNLVKTMRTAQGRRAGKLRIIEIGEDKATFSFFNFIFIGRSSTLSAEDQQKIILHEAAHAKKLHSFDILLLNIVSVFFWFNPFIKIYKKIFVQLHEFEADARAAENDVNEYCTLLAKAALKSAGFPLANHFNNSIALKRIEMMRTIKQKIRPWKLMVIASVIPLTFFMTACQEQLVNELSTAVDETAIPIGGMGAFYEHIGKKIKYPAGARQKSIQGKVFIEFVVNEDGSIDVTGTSGIGGGCNLEAMQVVQSAPNWIPAKRNGVATKQRMVLPIAFKLDIPGKFQDVKAPEGSLSEIVVVGWTAKSKNRAQ
jgi:TonB family protein